MFRFRRRRAAAESGPDGPAAHEPGAGDPASRPEAAYPPEGGEYLPPPAYDSAADNAAQADESADADGRMTARNVRRVLILVALGSIAAAVITLVSTGNLDSVFGSSAPSEATEADDAPQKTGSAEGEAFADADAGTCLTWQDSDDPEITKVDCTEPHYFEVGSRVDLSRFPSSEFGPHAQTTDAQRYAKIRDTVCKPDVTRYLGGNLDPAGRFTVGLVHPGEKGWGHGERTVLCGLQETGVDGTAFQPITGRVAEQSQARIHQPGTCLGIDNGLPTDPVDCAEEHSVEVTGNVDLSQKFTDGWPAVDDQDEFLADACADISEDYLGGGYEALHDTTLTVYWDTVSLPSWLAGTHTVDCTIGYGTDEGAYAVLTGSAKGTDLMIDGEKPEAEPLPPLRRSPQSGSDSPGGPAPDAPAPGTGR